VEAVTVPTISVGIARTELEDDPLVITNYLAGASGMWIPEDGITEPEFQTRVAYAPESFYMAGKLPLAAQQDAGGLQLVIYAKAADAAALEVVKAELAAALNQWRPDIATNIDGVTKTYEVVYPITPHWGTVDSGMVKAHMARTSVTVVVNPPGA
jgi:hypothetical protein